MGLRLPCHLSFSACRREIINGCFTRVRIFSVVAVRFHYHVSHFYLSPVKNKIKKYNNAHIREQRCCKMFRRYACHVTFMMLYLWWTFNKLSYDTRVAILSWPRGGLLCGQVSCLLRSDLALTTNKIKLYLIFIYFLLLLTSSYGVGGKNVFRIRTRIQNENCDALQCFTRIYRSWG